MKNYIQREFIDRYDPDYAYLKQAIRTALAALIAVIIYRLQSQVWLEGYWMVLAAAFLMQTRLGKTQTQQLIFLSMAILGAAVLAYIAQLLYPYTFWLAIFLAITTFIAIYCSKFGLNFAIESFFINLFGIISAGIEPTIIIERPLMILLGGGFALIMCFLWPVNLTKQAGQNRKIYLRCLAELSISLGESYLHPDYHSKKDKFEKHLHERRNRLLRTLNSLRHSEPQATDFLSKAEHLFELLLALGNIRHYLLPQHSLDSLREELLQVHQYLANNLIDLAKQKKINNAGLNQLLSQLTEKINKTSPLYIQLVAFINNAKTIEEVIACI